MLLFLLDEICDSVFLSLPAFNYSPEMCRCPCLSFRLYIKCCTVCSRFTFVCNLPSLHITAPTLVTQWDWTKLPLHVLQLCTVCWQTAEMWMFAILTWWGANHSAQISGETSVPCLYLDLCIATMSIVRAYGDGYHLVCICALRERSGDLSEI